MYCTREREVSNTADKQNGIFMLHYFYASTNFQRTYVRSKTVFTNRVLVISELELPNSFGFQICLKLLII